MKIINGEIYRMKQFYETYKDNEIMARWARKVS